MTPLDNIWQVALALVGTVGLVVVLGYLAKRFQLTRPSSNGLLKVVDSTYLGPKEKLVLVQVANQQVLIGIAGQEMTRLAQYEASADFQSVLAGVNDRNQTAGDELEHRVEQPNRAVEDV